MVATFIMRPFASRDRGRRRAEVPTRVCLSTHYSSESSCKSLVSFSAVWTNVRPGGADSIRISGKWSMTGIPRGYVLPASTRECQTPIDRGCCHLSALRRPAFVPSVAACFGAVSATDFKTPTGSPSSSTCCWTVGKYGKLE
jgi:hypothetical protein